MNCQYCTAHGRSNPSDARISSISFCVASAGIMIWIGSPDSRTSKNTTTDTTNIDTTDCTNRPRIYRGTTPESSDDPQWLSDLGGHVWRGVGGRGGAPRSEEHTSELQSL